ncbi:malate dehydrogenase (quinone) [Occultella glacieicola]|uniref:Probable malate:quinone oxidoreductase n=1 Tax=Occultella glacieicola TaxID=2518684 RepID=A0ABY2EBY8_9MICO|nr:malate dehydrogenase (quinone) [Occultella glacieicola]TDE98682.1 malate dehydrogenase (quinone) [Occultella glacieicola]
MGSGTVDVALIGAGIMSATLGTLIQHLEPDWNVEIFEALDAPALESSNAWHNAGTGHAGFCELDYATRLPGGGLDVSKAIAIGEQFQVTRQFWSALVARGELPTASRFVNPTPHLAFVAGAENVAFLRQWHDALKEEPLFANLHFSDDPARIGEWSRALVDGRGAAEPIAAAYEASGTDVDYGALTRALIDALVARGARLHLRHPVTGLRRDGEGWMISHRTPTGIATTPARFVFVGAGGGSLRLLQSSGIPEANGFGGFPVSGRFLRTRKPEVVRTHPVKAYGKADKGVPGLGAPHLDHRTVDGEDSLLFGPFAGWDPRFLKSGSRLDLFRSIRPGNIGPMLSVAKDNFDLLKYLVGEITASPDKQMSALRRLMPSAADADWEMIDAGKRVQVIGRNATGRGVLQFGTELVVSPGNNLAGLLGASPGASTAVPVMIRLLQEAFGDRFDGWTEALRELVPSLGRSMNTGEDWSMEIRRANAETLGLAGV